MDLSKMDAAELDDLIAKAAKSRAKLKPAVPNDPPKGPVNALNNPRWFSVLQGDITVLQVQHPGLGWITWLLPTEERANLLSVLLRQALAPTSAKVADVPAAGAGGGTVH